MSQAQSLGAWPGGERSLQNRKESQRDTGLLPGLCSAVGVGHPHPAAGIASCPVSSTSRKSEPAVRSSSLKRALGRGCHWVLTRELLAKMPQV